MVLLSLCWGADKLAGLMVRVTGLGTAVVPQYLGRSWPWVRTGFSAGDAELSEGHTRPWLRPVPPGVPSAACRK